MKYDKKECDFFHGSSRPVQSELKLVCNDFERSELSGNIDIRSWCVQENTGEICKIDSKIVSSSPMLGEAGM